jgi:hypothetical protein
MKKSLFLFACLIVSCFAQAQITITAADMPVNNDTLRYSTASPASGATINLQQTGANTVWNFSTLSPIAQGLDQYKSALSVNPIYALTIATTAYGYKIADTLNLGAALPLPIAITDVYTFFSKKTNPSRFVAEAFAAKVSGLPTPINYSDEDEWYYFPLTYNRLDSSTYKLSVTIPTLGALDQNGKRKTRVDGWGTIVTPYATNPVNCLRIRSEINEIDTFTFNGMKFGFPRNSVDYKWLANGERYPLLWITTNKTGTTETIASIRYRDTYRVITSVEKVANAVQEIKAYPNPASYSISLAIPSSWINYEVRIFNQQGAVVATYHNQETLPLQALASGCYFVQVQAGSEIAFAKFQK